MTAQEIVERVEQRGGHVVVKGDRVGIVPKAAATSELLDALREHKAHFIAIARDLGRLATVKVAQFRQPQEHDANCHCSSFEQHLNAGGSCDAWRVSHPDDQGTISLDKIMQMLARLHGPCGVCGTEEWRWDAVGQIYKCLICHPNTEVHHGKEAQQSPGDA